MPRVCIKIHAWLIPDGKGDASKFSEIYLTVSEEESLYQVLYRLAAKNETFSGVIFPENTDRIREDVLVTVNGRIVRFDEFSGRKLCEQDEITFLPLLSGG